MELFAAVLLIVMQTAPPVPRKAADKPTGSRQPIQSETNTKQNPAISTKVAGDEEEYQGQQQAGTPQDSHKQPIPIIVQEIPTSGWEKAYVLFTFCLVAIGFTGVIYAIRTLKAVEVSANAALLNAQAVINSERPWMLVEVRWEKREGLEGYMFYAVNKGRTPADIVSAYFEKEFATTGFENWPIPPQYKSPVAITGDLLMVRDEKWPLSPPVHVESWIDNRLKRDVVMNADETPVFYGQITYRDVLRPKSDPESLHYSRWCFVYLAGLNIMIPSGPDEYRSKS